MSIVNKMKKKTKMWLIKAFSLLILVALIGFGIWAFNNPGNKAEIITKSTLEKIVNISELSTYQAVYNGIGISHNEENKDVIDYYVAYEAKVYAGFNVKDVRVSSNEVTKKITVIIPEIAISDVNVDFASMEFIFQTKKAKSSTVSAEAYKLCEADALEESASKVEILEMAQENAKIL